MAVPNEVQESLKIALDKTGFPLENYVCNHLNRLGWNSIGGRYYCDDIDGRAREIDILSYKIGRGKVVDVVSVLLISCKKDHSNSWVFLSKKKPKKDPNYSWDPVCIYSSNPLISSLWSKNGLGEKYKENIGNLKKQLIDVEKDIFAFQLVKGDSPQNDKSIFSSIESLIKAREHEKKSLKSKLSNENRKSRRRVYVFNLLTVVDAQMYEVDYGGRNLVVRDSKSIKYLARYIVDKEEVVARVHFFSRSWCGKELNKYESLSRKEIDFFDANISEAYERWWEDPQRDILSKMLAPKMRDLLSSYSVALSANIFDGFFSIKMHNDVMRIEVGLAEDEVFRLNSRRPLAKKIKRLLREQLNYEGGYELVEAIPF